MFLITACFHPNLAVESISLLHTCNAGGKSNNQNISKIKIKRPVKLPVRARGKVKKLVRRNDQTAKLSMVQSQS